MTKLETQARIEVMQAYVDGYDIEFRNFEGHVWANTISPVWNPEASYRVKPASHAIEANEAMERFFDDIRSIVDDHKVNSANFFEHLGKKLKP